MLHWPRTVCNAWAIYVDMRLAFCHHIQDVTKKYNDNNNDGEKNMLKKRLRLLWLMMRHTAQLICERYLSEVILKNGKRVLLNLEYCCFIDLYIYCIYRGAYICICWKRKKREEDSFKAKPGLRQVIEVSIAVMLWVSEKIIIKKIIK